MGEQAFYSLFVSIIQCWLSVENTKHKKIWFQVSLILLKSRNIAHISWKKCVRTALYTCTAPSDWKKYNLHPFRNITQLPNLHNILHSVDSNLHFSKHMKFTSWNNKHSNKACKATGINFGWTGLPLEDWIHRKTRNYNERFSDN